MAASRDRLLAGLFLVWALFSAWYTNWKGPLSPEEIEHYLTLLQTRKVPVDTKKLEALRAFMESDTGHQFVMTNVIDLAPDGSDKMTMYAKHIIPAMLSRASHPALVGKAVGSAVDLTGIEGAEHWSQAAIVRYRSRRDVMDMGTNPAFEEFHDYKIEAMTKTIAFPVESEYVFMVGCDLRVFLALLFLAIPTVLDISARIAAMAGRKQTTAKQHDE